MLTYPIMVKRYSPTDEKLPTLDAEHWLRGWECCSLADDGFGTAVRVPDAAYGFVVGRWIYEA